MATKASIAKMKYDKTHVKQYPLRMNLVYDADIIDKLSSVPNVQGYIKQLIREDLTRTDSMQIPENTMSILKEKAAETGNSVPTLVNLIISEWILHNK